MERQINKYGALLDNSKVSRVTFDLRLLLLFEFFRPNFDVLEITISGKKIIEIIIVLFVVI